MRDIESEGEIGKGIGRGRERARASERARESESEREPPIKSSTRKSKRYVTDSHNSVDLRKQGRVEGVHGLAPAYSIVLREKMIYKVRKLSFLYRS